jgi:hypothetical protein
MISAEFNAAFLACPETVAPAILVDIERASQSGGIVMVSRLPLMLVDCSPIASIRLV